LSNFDSTPEDLVKLLSGLGRLRDLTVNDVEMFSEMAVLRALPQTLERFELAVQYFGYDDQMTILGNLSRLEDLDLFFISLGCWLNLLPAAASLKKLFMWVGPPLDEDFYSLISSMKSLKSLELFMGEGEGWDEVLQAVANLELLETLRLTWQCCLVEATEKGLLYLANGTVRRSLVNCVIRATIASYTQRREYLIRCFENEVSPLFDRKSEVDWKLILERTYII